MHFKLGGQWCKVTQASRSDSDAVMTRIAAEQAWTHEDMGYTADAVNPKARIPQIQVEGKDWPLRWHLSCAKIELTTLTEEAKAALEQMNESNTSGMQLGSALDIEFGDTESEDYFTRILNATTEDSPIETDDLISIELIDSLVDWMCETYSHRGCTTATPSSEAPSDHHIWSGTSRHEMVAGAYVHKKDSQATDKFILYHITQAGTPGAFSAIRDYANFIVPTYRKALGKKATREMVQDLISRVNIGIGLGMMPFALRKDRVKAAANILLESGTTTEGPLTVQRDIKRPLKSHQERACAVYAKHNTGTRRPSRKHDKRQQATEIDLIMNSRAHKRLETQIAKAEASKSFRGNRWLLTLKPDEMFDLKHSEAVKRALQLLGLGETASAMNIIGNIAYSVTETSTNTPPNLCWLKGLQGKASSDSDNTALSALRTLEEDHIVWPYNWHNGLFAEGRNVTPTKLRMEGRLILSGYTVAPTIVDGPDGNMPGLTLVEYDANQKVAADRSRRPFKPRRS